MAQPLRCIVLGHRWLIAALVAVPVLVVLLLGVGRTSGYSATARIQATSVPLGSDTEADSVLNRVRGIATGPAVVAQALRRANISDHDPATVAAHKIAVSRLGSSAVIDITIVDRHPKVARHLATALSTTVVDFLADPPGGSATSLTAQLEAQQRDLLSGRERLVAQLAATRPAQAAALSARLATVEQEITDTATTLRQLQVGIGLAGSAAAISPAASAHRVPSDVVIDAVLAGVAGLAAGLLIATLLEMARPRFAGARAVADELGVPLLGAVRPPAGVADASADGKETLVDRATALAVREAARAAGVSTVLQVGPTPDTVPNFASRLQSELGGREHPSPNGRVPVSSTMAVPETRVTTAPWAETDGLASAPLRSRTAAATLAARPSRPHACGRGQVRIVALDHADTDPSSSGVRGLLVTASGYTPAREVQRVNDLARASGWPVLGVIDVSAHTGRWRSK